MSSDIYVNFKVYARSVEGDKPLEKSRVFDVYFVFQGYKGVKYS